MRRSEGENDLKYHIENGGGWNRTFCNYRCFNFSKLGMSVLQEMDIILDIDGVNLDRMIDSLLGPSITHQTNIGSHWGSKR